MIELKNHELHFSFSEPFETVRNLASDYALKTLPLILAEDRDAALDACFRGNFRYEETSQEDQQTLREQVRLLPPEKIAAFFKKKVHRTALPDCDCCKSAQMSVAFKRTLRVPNDGKDHFLPPGFGEFPLQHVDDYADRAPASWLERGGVMLPMYQAEALWINFNSSYPFAVKIASGKINAITGAPWQSGLHRQPQDYLVLPEQPWLDGFVVGDGVVRQFVAMPLGTGASVEEQSTGKAETGGIQIQVFPMKAEYYFRNQVLPLLPRTLEELLPEMLAELEIGQEVLGRCSKRFIIAESAMGLGAGGKIKQQVYQDPHELDVWDTSLTSRCFVHLCNALVWREITGTNPPQPPITAKEYQQSGMPWFDFYRDDLETLEGSEALAKLKTVGVLSADQGTKPVPSHTVSQAPKILNCGPQIRPREVRQWAPVEDVLKT